MSNAAPLLDARTATQLREDLTNALRGNVPEWSPTDPATGAPDQASTALIAIVARFAELVIERLNQAPNKNFLAFLDLLGAAPLPPEPARVPLTFTVTAGSASDAVVPAGTRIAAAPAPGDAGPVIFETERELTAVAASLQTLIAVDAERDLIADHSALLASPAANGVLVFAGDRPNEHVLYIGHAAYLSYPQLAALTLNVKMSAESPAAADARVLQWEIWDGENGVPLTAVDGTQGLRATGTISFANLAQIPEQSVQGVRSRWLRCRLLTPVSPGASPAQGMVRAGQLPLVAELRVSAQLQRTALVPEIAFANSQAVDVSRAFLPFGEKPRIGDTFYMAHAEAFGQPGAVITLDLALVNPLPDSADPVTVPSGDLTLRWETWNGTSWALHGETTPVGQVSGTSLADGTKAFTKSSTVTFTLPQTLAPTTVNGVSGNWVRVQIVAGNYGTEAHYVPDESKPGGFRLELATFAPPMVRTLALSYGATLPPAAPDAVVAFNNAQYQNLEVALKAGRAAPFIGFEAQPPALYAAVTLPPARKTFPNRTLSLYPSVRVPPYGETLVPLSPGLSVQTAAAGSTATHRFTLTNTSSETLNCTLATLGGKWASSVERSQLTLPPGLASEIKVSVTVPAEAANVGDRGFLNVRFSGEEPLCSVAFETLVGGVAPRRRELRFEYWNGSGWAKLLALDGTNALSEPGVVEMLAPADFQASEQFGASAYWMRAVFDSGDDQPVQLRTLLLNTTFATQAVTLRNEVLGSSDASANLQFRTTRNPVLAGAQLEVREAGATQPPGESWVSWTEVPDFHGSTSQDRHYVLDHVSGTVLFGDGVQGRIPPRGVGNVRMARYQTGGGSAGNRPAGAIVQLKTTVPYIDKVTNFEPATGGIDAEPDAAFVARAPRLLRNGGRAVAFDDYEDLARAASPEVARARAVPLRRLDTDPVGTNRVPGAVSIVVVPQSLDAKPTPSTTLLARVEQHVRSLSTPTATVAAVGPIYVRVDVSLEIALVSLDGASAVEIAVREALRAFLHPLTGGRNGAGWDFGREPALSDLHAVVAGVAGVDHIRALHVDQVEELQGALNTDRFLVYSGHHQITLT